MKTILYIHGMGGGGDSRIPRLLRERFEGTDISVVVRTYDFDPEVGNAQIRSWIGALEPDMLIGESLGAAQVLRFPGIPQLFVSPALGAPAFLYRLAWVPLLPGGRAFLHHLWPVKEGDRQPLRFEYGILRKYKAHREATFQGAKVPGYRFAFFGVRDHYKKWGVVKISTWRKMFGDTFQEYDGTHFMEEEYVYSMLVPKIREVLQDAPDAAE